MLTITRTEKIEATTEAAMMARPVVYQVARFGKAPETFKSHAHRLAFDMSLIAGMGYRLIDVVFPLGFSAQETESLWVDILETAAGDVIVTRDDIEQGITSRPGHLGNGRF